MKMEQTIQDHELGQLVIRVNKRARNFVFRTKSDAIYVTVPPGTVRSDLLKAINDLRKKLIAAQQKLSRSIFDLNYKMDAPLFKLSFSSGKGDQFLAHAARGQMEIICPANANFEDENLQLWLRKVIEEALKKNAKLILPVKLRELSLKYGFTYSTVKINSSKGRWGSCSAGKNINFSYYMILLPEHLIDYVILHELCHTKEMNHGEKFWAILNECTGGKALSLRKELKSYKTDF